MGGPRTLRSARRAGQIKAVQRSLQMVLREQRSVVVLGARGHEGPQAQGAEVGSRTAVIVKWHRIGAEPFAACCLESNTHTHTENLNRPKGVEKPEGVLDKTGRPKPHQPLT